jgi:hypothetical protein
MAGQMPTSDVGGLAIKFGQCAMPESDFVRFATVMVVITGTFSSLIISQIQRGNIKNGLRYIPVFILIGILSFYIFRMILGSILGAVFSF